MKKVIALLALLVVGALAVASPAVAADLQCNGTYSGPLGNVVVPAGGICMLNSAQVAGNIDVGTNGYLEAHGTSVTGFVRGQQAQTVYLVDSSVGGDVSTNRTAQAFLFGLTVKGSVSVRRATDKVNVCGVKVLTGSLRITRSGRDILVGDPLAEGCPGNVVKRGDVEISGNATDIELVVRGNVIRRGDLTVEDNTGTSDKFVQTNAGGGLLTCRSNSRPFASDANTGFDRARGQCAAAKSFGHKKHKRKRRHHSKRHGG